MKPSKPEASPTRDENPPSMPKSASPRRSGSIYSFGVVTSPSQNEIDLRSFEEQELIDAAANRLPLIWDRGGNKRRVPVSLIANAVRAYMEYRRMEDKALLAGLWKELFTIRWEETEAIPVSTEVRFQPVPGPGPDARGESGVHAPAD
jgi:hypothetical protein